jgi:hypothetical protein
LGFVGLGHGLHLIAHFFIDGADFCLKLFDGCFILSFFFVPSLVVLQDDIVILLLDLRYILAVVGLVVVLIVHAILLDVLDGLFEVSNLLEVFLFILLLCVLQVVVLVLQQNLVLIVHDLDLIAIIDNIIKLLFEL